MGGFWHPWVEQPCQNLVEYPNKALPPFMTFRSISQTFSKQVHFNIKTFLSTVDSIPPAPLPPPLTYPLHGVLQGVEGFLYTLLGHMVAGVSIARDLQCCHLQGTDPKGVNIHCSCNWSGACRNIQRSHEHKLWDRFQAHESLICIIHRLSFIFNVNINLCKPWFDYSCIFTSPSLPKNDKFVLSLIITWCNLDHRPQSTTKQDPVYHMHPQANMSWCAQQQSPTNSALVFWGYVI